MTNICKKCAECCKNHPFVDLSSKDIISLEKLTEGPSEVFANQKGKEVEEYFLQFQNNGYCIFLREISGSFSCGVYEARPEVCRDYPARPRQQDFCDAKRKEFMKLNNMVTI